VGLTDLVADSQDAYVELAVKLAGNGEWRAHLHATLRSCLESSPFCDGVGFTRQLEDAYRSMWKRWCEDEVL
jgi:predicted O-linked N-acetylglucosamine transferase (SPINDLY family)